MINTLLKFFIGKGLILYNPHRNSLPLVNDENQKKFVFLNSQKIWKFTGLFGRETKLRYGVMYRLLSILNPVYIIDINWILKRHSLFLVWCNKHNRYFIVVQHGIYHGGIIQDVAEKYVKCHIFLVWGEHFKKMFKKNNKGKNFECIQFGNPVYNKFDRSKFLYKKEVGNKVLVALSVIEGERLVSLYKLLDRLGQLGFDITIKEHALQKKITGESITGYPSISTNLYELLQKKKYDIVITDVSSALIDVIFFKNRAIYFSPEENGSSRNKNIYSDFLKNMAGHLSKIKSKDDFIKLVDIESQEKLLDYLIKTENTSNDLSRI